jgi:hypothetical protein
MQRVLAKELLAGVPNLAYANKHDLPNAMSTNKLIDALGCLERTDMSGMSMRDAMREMQRRLAALTLFDASGECDNRRGSQ